MPSKALEVTNQSISAQLTHVAKKKLCFRKNELFGLPFVT
jgi:hypothetical protein